MSTYVSILGSQGWSLYAGLTVITFLAHNWHLIVDGTSLPSSSVGSIVVWACSVHSVESSIVRQIIPGLYDSALPDDNLLCFDCAKLGSHKNWDAENCCLDGIKINTILFTILSCVYNSSYLNGYNFKFQNDNLGKFLWIIFFWGA